MSWKQNLKNPLFQQYALELLLPLIGFFIFDWSLLLIGTYFLIDHLASQTFFYQRAISVRKFHGTTTGKGIMIISIVAFIGLFVFEMAFLSTLVLHVQNVTMDVLMDDLWKLGKEELWFLIPLVFFAYYLKDKMTFYMSRAFVRLDFNKMIRWDLLSQLIMVALLAIGVLIWIMYFTYPGWIILSFLLAKILFDLTLKKIIRMKSVSVSN